MITITAAAVAALKQGTISAASTTTAGDSDDGIDVEDTADEVGDELEDFGDDVADEVDDLFDTDGHTDEPGGGRGLQGRKADGGGRGPIAGEHRTIRTGRRKHYHQLQ